MSSSMVQESFVGDFADQAGVALPVSYLTVVTLDAPIASVSRNGLVTGLTNGTTVLMATGHGIEADPRRERERREFVDPMRKALRARFRYAEQRPPCRAGCVKGDWRFRSRKGRH